MITMKSPDEMADAYNARWPERPQLHYEAGWLHGVWMIGWNYKNNSGFYGAYPPSLLERYRVTFERGGERILHLFSGRLPPGEYVRFDIKESAEVQGDARDLANVLRRHGCGKFDIIYADPPYSAQDAKVYGTGRVDKRIVLRECAKVLNKNGLLVWLDTQTPMFRKIDFEYFGTICLVRSTNHRVRLVSIFRKR